MSRVLSLMFVSAGCVLASFTWEFVWISGWWPQTYDVSAEEREFRTDKITYLMILVHPRNVRSETRKEVACLVYYWQSSVVIRFLLITQSEPSLRKRKKRIFLVRGCEGNCRNETWKDLCVDGIQICTSIVQFTSLIPVGCYNQQSFKATS